MASLVHVTAWERVSLWRRVPCAFARVAVLIAALALLLSLLGPPTVMFFTARWEAKRVPGLKVAPQQLADYSVSDAPGTVLSYFGYQFDVPWKATFKQRGGTNIMGLMFASGQALVFIKVPDDRGGLLNEIVQDPSLKMANLRPVFGDLMNRSAYDQYSVLLNTTPQSIRVFGPRAESVRGMILLTIKAIALPKSLETGAFSFELPDKRGFQIGDPNKSKRVQLEVFGMGGHYVEIVIQAERNGVMLSQPEINRILTSLHAVGQSPSVAPSAPLNARPN